MMDYYDRCKVLSRVSGTEKVLKAQSLFQLGGNVREGASREMASNPRQLVAVYLHGLAVGLCVLAVLKGQRWIAQCNCR